MQYTVVGDVHGCIEELKSLVFPENTTIVFLGDLVDKGPDSNAVVDYVRELSTKYVVEIVMGNHEEKVLRKACPSISKQNHEFLAQRAVYYYSFDKYLCVHGGVYPAYQEQYGFLSNEDLHTWNKNYALTMQKSNQLKLDLANAKSKKNYPLVQDLVFQLEEFNNEFRDLKKQYTRMLRLTMTRFVDNEGQTVSLGQEKPGDKFWTDVYSGPYFVFYGHTPFDTVNYTYNTMGLDTGAVYGNKLSAVTVDTSTGSMKLQQVFSKKYAERMVF